MVSLNDYDRQIYREIKDFLPDNIIDSHTHCYLEEHFTSRESSRGAAWANKVASQCSAEELVSSYKAFFPDKTVTPVIFGSTTNIDYGKNNAYVKQEAKKRGFPYLFNVKPTMSPDELEAAFDGGAAGIKPYLSQAPDYLPEEEIRCFDFLTHEHLAVCNRRKAVVMLHIPRSGRMRDPVNLAQIMEIEQKYPDAKVVLAHVGRAYAPEDFGDGFKVLAKTERMLVDFSANTLDAAIEAALEAVGPKRVLFGTDMPIVIMRMRRIVENGTYINVVPPGMYGDIKGIPHMREAHPEEQLSFFMYEIILAAKRAMSGASRQDVEDVFYNNAKRVFQC